MKILITGGAGFIGSNFTQYWSAKYPEDAIVVLDKLTYAGNLENLSQVKDKITFVKGDVTDEAIVNDVMQDVDTVVHFAAESHVDRSIDDPYIFTRTNVLGTHVLLEAARKNNVKRFHHISTDEVFGSIPLDQNYKFSETSKYEPNSPYAASKAASDHLVLSYFKTYGLPVTITNCSNNFGPYQHPEKFIARSIIRLLSRQNIRLYSPGDQIRDWLYVEDHCRAIETVLKNGVLGETYCVGGMTAGISNMDVAKLLLKIFDLPEDRIELVTDRPGHDVKYDIDWTKIKQELSWGPEHNFEDWLKQTVEWYKANQAWWQPQIKAMEDFYVAHGEKVI